MEHFSYLEQASHDVRWVPFELPDIIAALPEILVLRAFPDANKDTRWSTIIDRWRDAGTPSFKRFALDQFGLQSVKPDDFVDRILARSKPTDHPDAALIRPVKAAVASLAHGQDP